MEEPPSAYIIDAHNHPDVHGTDFDAFVEDMDRNGIAKSWLLTWQAPADECEPAFIRTTPGWIEDGSGPIPFSRCLRYKERAPDRFVLGYGPDPRRPEAVDALAAAADIYGARVCGELKLRMMYDSPDAVRLFRFCGAEGFPVVVHLDYEFDAGAKYPRPSYWYGGGIEALERAIRRCPDTVFLGHAPGFWGHISGDGKHLKDQYPKGRVKKGGALVRTLREYPNLFCDISARSGLEALSRDKSFAQEFLDEFRDRVLFGRDSTGDEHLRFLDSLRLPDEVREKIYSGNALRLVPEG